MSEQLVPGKAGIDEEQVAASAPMVRALIVARLEQVWRACDPHINPTQDALNDGFRRDPRYIEAGLRVLDRLSQIYLRIPLRDNKDIADGAQELLEAQNRAIEALERLESKSTPQGD